MVGQADPVSPDEWLLRRVPYSKQNNIINLSDPQPIDRQAFRPSSNDHDGLSIFRELFVTAEQIADDYRQRKGKECYVVRIKARTLLDQPIGANLAPAPINDLPGHTLVPELNLNFQKSDKKSCKAMQYSIAKTLKEEDIVHWPRE